GSQSSFQARRSRGGCRTNTSTKLAASTVRSKVEDEKCEIIINGRDMKIAKPGNLYTGTARNIVHAAYGLDGTGFHLKDYEFDTLLQKKSMGFRNTTAYAVSETGGKFALYNFERRQPAADDVLVRIHYCGICHTDIHVVNNDFGMSQYPVVPGHEIVGVVEKVGDKVKKFKVGDLVGIGTQVDSCRQCKPCNKDLEQYCEKGSSLTYASTEQDKVTRTQGGYSNLITVKEHFVCKVPKNLKPEEIGPLMCAGITTYSPLKKHNVGKDSKVAIVGLGGLGHMGVKFAVALGADVTVISTSESKRQDALRMGAKHFVISKDPEQFESVQNTFNLILDTVSAEHDVGALLNLLAFEGVYCIVGIPAKPLEIPVFALLKKPLVVCGSGVGGMKETQEMLDFCGQKQITCEVELISPATPEILAKAYERTLKADVKYRFVIDCQKTFAEAS
ncbi:unnamed protein product, partial [Didymodactylos carnosus]